MRLAQAFDMFVAVACEADLNLILPIARKGVRNQHAAASAQWQTLDVFFLCEIGWHAKRITPGPGSRRADSQTTNLFGSGDVTIQKRGRKIGDSDKIGRASCRERV